MTENRRSAPPRQSARPGAANRAPAGNARPGAAANRPASGANAYRQSAGRPASGANAYRQSASRPASGANAYRQSASRPASGANANRQSASRPANRPAPRGGYALPRDLWKVLVVSAIAIVLALGAQRIWPNGFTIEEKKAEETGTASAAKGRVQEIHSSGPVRLNELMSVNDTTLLSEEGETPDWVEIMNVSNREVNLEGYSLAKSEKATNVFTFPKCVLQPGEAVIVYADSTLKSEAGAELHAPFRLSSAGGTVMLFSTSGTAIDSVNFPALGADNSYVRLDQTTWAMSNQPTPGLSNTENSYRQLHQANADAGIEITEIVASNRQYAPDENGLYQDYFELHNKTDHAIDLSNWYASDDPAKPTAWRFPQGFALQPGEYRIVYASGLNRADAEHPHTSFGLSPEGETLLISDANSRLVDSVTYDLLKTDEAWLKRADGTWSAGAPTPGMGN